MSIIAPLKRLSAITWPDTSTFNPEPRAPEPTHKWMLGKPGKGFITQDGAVHTWPTNHMKPTHIEEETRRQMASGYKIAPTKRGSEFHIEPTGRVWQFGNGRQLDAQDQQTIQRTPNIWMGDPADNSPVQQDGYGHAIGLATPGEVEVQNQSPATGSSNPQDSQSPVVSRVVDMWESSLLDTSASVQSVKEQVDHQEEEPKLSHGRIIAWSLNTCSRCGNTMTPPDAKLASHCVSCHLSRQLSKEAAGAFIPALQMKPPTHECPGCQLPLRDNGWTGYTPQSPEGYGERTWRCPECNLNWESGRNRPRPAGAGYQVPAPGAMQTQEAIMLGSSIKRLNSRVADNATLDSREWPDPTEPRASDAPQPEGCTCPEGHKLDCPVHGMEGDDSHDLGWSLPEGSPVGYPQDMPRTYQQVMGATYYHNSPTENRSDISTWGLMTSSPAANPVWEDKGEAGMVKNQPSGVYLSPTPNVFHNAPKGTGVDMWQVEADPANIVKDPVHPGALLHQGPIDPKQISMYRPYEGPSNLWRPWPKDDPRVSEVVAVCIPVEQSREPYVLASRVL
jgi:hypothetical protein